MTEGEQQQKGDAMTERGQLSAALDQCDVLREERDRLVTEVNRYMDERDKAVHALAAIRRILKEVEDL